MDINNLTVSTFESLFETILRHPDDNIKIFQTFKKLEYSQYMVYNVGVKLCERDNITTEEKEQIIYKLIFLFPKNHVLLYFMGILAATKDKYRAMTWYRLSYEVEKDNINNIINLFKMLFDNEYSNFIADDILHEIYKKNPKDERVLLLFSAIYSKKNNFHMSELLCSELIVILENKYKTNKNDKINNNMLSNAYSNLIYICSFSLIYNDQFFETIKKTYNYLRNNTVEISTQREGFLNVLFYNYDYIYYDLQERTNTCKYIVDRLYTPENKFNLSRPKLANKKIRIGYVSADFISHAVSNFILPILDHHDSSKFEIILFTDKYYQELKNVIKKHLVIDFQGRGTDDCAKMIHDCKIDILFDLNGFTSNNRLDVFSKNPAPIQITYIGYPNSLVTNFIKYKISDYIADNINSKQIYTEELLRLPKSFLLFRPNSQHTPLQMVMKQPTDTVILGALNKELKNSKNTLEVWKRILNETTNTKLLIKLCSRDNGGNVQKSIDYYTKQLGVSADRLIIKSWQEHSDYIGLFKEIDILLDTFPYSGTTTSCHALYNSVPIVTIYNVDYHIHNVTASFLTHSGFPELITHSEDEYVTKVKELCNTVNKVNEYKTSISKGFAQLMEPTQFMKSYEETLLNLFNTNTNTQYETEESLKQKYPHIYNSHNSIKSEDKFHQFSYMENTEKKSEVVNEYIQIIELPSKSDVQNFNFNININKNVQV
jgi:predicted O-linked N-acetylglucosamine transferase (SPINDLY family)